jgi:hypothetical protein
MRPGTMGETPSDRARKIAFASHLMRNIVIVSDIEDDDQRIWTSLCTCPLVIRCKPVDHDMTEKSKYVDALLPT